MKTTASLWANQPEPIADPKHVSRQGRKTVVIKPEPTTAEVINKFLKSTRSVRG